LLKFALLDDGIFVTPATAANYLLICQHGGAFGTPVDLAFLPIGEAALVELQKNH